MNNCSPLFYEENLSSPSGQINLKIFVDRDSLKIHILAVQSGTCRDYSSKLVSRIKNISPCKKAYILCYVNSPDELQSIKNSIDRYISQISI